MFASNKTPLRAAAMVAVSFVGFALAVLVLLGRGVVTPQMALLMLVALLGLYLGFGVLIAIWRLTGKLR
ncbi:MAG TPA: hypothetical protein VK025_15375 [Steroidobacter sp.]|jgi:uncharacterized membrane protein YqjE|nr:hypothetical protein [Steroidobacteraceae bacterium]HLS82780.1 hypothetical protein [Steroidobacter sp.]